MSRTVPRRSLPPCGGGTGRGVSNRHCGCLQFDVAFSRCSRSRRRDRCLQCSIATPLPVPPPQGGREPCGTHLRISWPADLATGASATPRQCVAEIPFFYENERRLRLVFSAKHKSTYVHRPALSRRASLRSAVRRGTESSPRLPRPSARPHDRPSAWRRGSRACP
jgi:hypothetical protein